MSELSRIPVTGESNYEVLVGRFLLDEIPRLIPPSSKKVLLVHPVALSTSAEAVRERLQAEGFEVLLAGVPDSEDAKRVEVAAFCWQIMGQADFTRTDSVIGFGGGSTTDLAGFVAGTWLRGVPLILIPTTLLGMVDAAIGGKTGVNTAEGKNLVGVFHAPSAVVVDLETLNTLNRNEILAGFGEVVKCGFIQDAEILNLIEADLAAATDPASDAFLDIVIRCIRIKAQVVSQDFKESGLREILNYGHTLGHAIENAERYQWRHGAAISVGMVFAAELAAAAGKLSTDVVDRHRSILESLGLPTTYRGDRWKQLLATMQRDKKARAGSLRFVILESVGRPTILLAPTQEQLFTAYQEIAQERH